MFDFHMHSSVSFDSTGNAREMAEEALKKGLKEICFTDHFDCVNDPSEKEMKFDIDEYNKTYDNLVVDGLTIRKGMEYGITLWNYNQFTEDLKLRDFDFVIGSVHFAEGKDPYFPEFWEGRSVKESFRKYLEETLKCVEIHDKYDVLGHLTYASKSKSNPTGEELKYRDFAEIADEILKTVISKGKGIEVNTSGIDACGVPLPSVEFIKRYKELGGEIITIGSDAHSPERVGQYTKECLEMIKNIFGYVCTFEERKPIFNKLT
jgi:histidinol-phosphatase (PHP family)